MSQAVKRFERNTQGRDLAIGDIHGHFAKLQVALDEVGFDPETDRLFSAGDLVDRGPDSDQVLEWLAKPWFHAVLGNHEEMAIELVYAPSFDAQMTQMYLANGGAWNLSNPRDLQQQIADEFAALPIVIEVESPLGTIGIVHAECPTHEWADTIAGLDHESEQERAYVRNACLWGRNRFDLGLATGKAYPISGIHAVINGHTPVNALTWLANTLMVDTGAWLRGRFTLVDLATLAEAALPVRDCGLTEEQLRVIPAMQA